MKITLPNKNLKEIKMLFEEFHGLNKKLAGVSDNTIVTKKLHDENFRRQCIVTELQRKTCDAKKETVVEYVTEILQHSDNKFLVFGHHAVMLDAMEQLCKKKKVEYIKITGSTPIHKRQDMVDTFRKDTSSYRVAILSMGACGCGLNFTPVSTAIFAETSFTPSLLSQCEARLHRIGAMDSINIIYIIAEDTLDQRTFDKLDSKFSIIDTIIDTGKNKTGFDRLENDFYIETQQNEKKFKKQPLPELDF
jgi:SWI/SNF-related matrix-associated actin-dependent regulator 1 of chromatin subfamily A